MKLTPLILALTLGATARAELRYMKVDRPDITMTFDADNGSAVIADESSGRVLLSGRTLVYDDVDTVRIDSAPDSPCPSAGVRFSSDLTDASVKRARVQLRPPPAPDSTCDARAVEGSYAHTR